jgi:hypothetical protein
VRRKLILLLLVGRGFLLDETILMGEILVILEGLERFITTEPVAQ